MSIFMKWIWSSGDTKQVSTTDASHDPRLRFHMQTFIDNTEPPASFKASEVAQAMSPKELANLGLERWEELMPAVIELAFELREIGDCEIMKKGKVLPDDVGPYDIEGGIRIRRVADIEFQPTTFGSRDAWLT
ncbi:hypothetical protein KC330_g6913 [Hortaea werneckii]|nr:hypothetical protein KC330_g6913 [Hortaea werneckii]